MKKFIYKISTMVQQFKTKAILLLKDNKGQGSLDTAFQILIGVVLAALLLAGLYALVGETVLPTLTEKVQSMFNYSN